MIISRKALRLWAEKQKPGAIVGRSHSIAFCPIAVYITARGGKDPYIGVRHIRWTDIKTGTRRELYAAPDIQETIHTIDNTYLGPVTRENFLTVLDTVDRIFGEG